MAGKIVKEIAILLLLVLAIIIIAGVLLYEYVPINKVVPDKVSYTTPENVKEELASTTQDDTTELVMTYQIDSTDLTNYKKTQDYVAGKKNPFSSLTSNDTSDNTTNGNANSSSNNTTSNNNSNSNTNTTEEGYLPDKGTK